jgi:hypothetical protein
MKVSSTPFFWAFGVAVIAYTAVFIAFYFLMDPYLLLNTPRSWGFNARKPAVESDPHHLMKIYEVLRTAPNTLLAGSSDVALGVNARGRDWPETDRPVFNVATGWESPDVAYRYLQHTLSRHHVSLVVLGLDFEDALNHFDFASSVDSHMLVHRDGSVESMSRRYAKDLLRSSFSLASLFDSAVELVDNFQENVPDLTIGGDIEASHPQRQQIDLGAFPVMTLSEIALINWYKDRPPNPQHLSSLRAFLDLCRKERTRAILFINPIHSDDLELLHFVGQWPAYERWERDLVSLTGEYAAAPSDARVVLWDFSGYDIYSTEAIVKQSPPLRWFVDLQHYTKPLGDRIIARIFGGGDPQFGIQLTPANIDDHLASSALQRQRYLKAHSADARRIRDIYETVTADNSLTCPQRALICGKSKIVWPPSVANTVMPQEQ